MDTIPYLSFLSVEVAELILLGCLILIFLLLILVIVLCLKVRKMNIRYNKFMQGNNGLNLEETIFKQINEIGDIRLDITKLNNEINNIKSVQLKTMQKIGIIKYNSFRELGGNLSFVLTLLDEKNNGFMINAMHTREGCYTYLKQVDNGEVAVQISEDERKSLAKAMK